jgi:hypothetical protein
LFPTQLSAVRILDLSKLERGDAIEVHHFDTVALRGQVDAVAPHLGILWIQQNACHGRKLVTLTEHEVWKL